MPKIKLNNIYIFIILLSLLIIIYKRYKVEGFDNNIGNVAILFAGRISSYEHVYKNLENIKDRYNPVVFCSLNEAVSTSYINRHSTTCVMIFVFTSSIRCQIAMNISTS
jgi:hypothetical protein